MEPSFRKRLRVFIMVGIFVIFFVGALGIWGAVKVYQSVATFSANPEVKNQLNDLKVDISKLPTVKGLSCFDKVQTLINPRPWIENPIMHNLVDLKNSCFEQKINNCAGPECAKKEAI